MARFLPITYALEQTLMKLYSFDCEEINLPFGLDRYEEAFKEVSPNVQALLQDIEERGRRCLKNCRISDGIFTNHQLLPVFPVVGMEGLGKTALARLVYEAATEGKLFDETVWISVSDYFEELTVLGEMLKTLDVDKWDGLKNGLLKVSGSNGSAVLVTTCSRHAASIKLYNLQTLRHIECTSLHRNMRDLLSLRHIYFTYHHQMPVKNDEEVLEALQPHSNLETLKIEHYGDEKLPSWLLMEIPSRHGDSLLVNSLVNLKLIDCKRCELPMLGHRPRSKSLEIDGVDNVRATDMEFYRSTGFSETMAVFPALKKLSLRRMVNLVEWMVPAVGEGHSVVFPCLEDLSIMSSIGKYFTECFITCSTGNLLL
ncbi:uncharacterized protein LOC133668095 [Populus nigra]|uniref:uncharacterized protein LOC133668095 n=1 Tax=Populus nigra TaxID=3691 RepID=UPI002B2739F3|nr:uncharacterized protein LOC133668095 [Populus nigra]